MIREAPRWCFAKWFLKGKKAMFCQHGILKIEINDIV